MQQYYAHTREGASEEEWQPLEDHLKAVADKAAEFASVFGASDWARIVGYVHDVGKGSEAFQERLRGRPDQVVHSTAGAQLLAEKYGDVGTQLAYLIAGHHGGLPDGTGHASKKAKRTPLKERLEKPVEPFDDFASSLDLPTKQMVFSAMPTFLRTQSDEKEKTFDVSFLLRMLYSCLVDADFLDTEWFMNPEKARLRSRTKLTLTEMQQKLSQAVSSFDANSSLVNAARATIHKACLNAAAHKPGIYTLTVPTGGGKTLASLDFALMHAIANGQERVIYAIPFTSIVEQTAATFKSIFGADAVLEHHCNYEYSDLENDEHILQQRLSMENWDAPLIVTTNVQLFESLYSDKPSRCRKNHNLANSVIILDEAQSLPDAYLKPCLAALEELSAHYGSSVVLCTATQPALEAVWPFDSRPIEIVPKESRFSELFDQRSRIENRGEMSLGHLVGELSQHAQALCIVSTRGAASAIYDELVCRIGAEGVFHLSALMVPKHRSAVLEKIRNRLASNLPCKVISTQLIEAGVDVDFPVVYREVAGIDSIKQAAGRCNREGRHATGHVYVFQCPEFAITSSNWLGRMRVLGQETIECVSDPFGDAGIEYFFNARYQVENTDSLEIMETFSEKQCFNLSFQFESCGEDFQFINNAGVTIFVPWGQEGCELLEAIRSGDVNIAQSRKIQSCCLDLPLYQFQKLQQASAITSYPPYWVLEMVDGELQYYSNEKGAQIDVEQETFIAI